MKYKNIRTALLCVNSLIMAHTAIEASQATATAATKLFSPVTPSHRTPLTSYKADYEANLAPSQRLLGRTLYGTLLEFPKELTFLIASYVDANPRIKLLNQTLKARDKVNQLVAISDTLFASASGKTIEIWQKQNNEWICISLLVHEQPVTCIAILAKDHELAERIASGQLNGDISVWNRKSSKSSPTLEYTLHDQLTSHKARITALAQLPETPLTFISASQDKTLGLHKKQLDGQWESKKIKCHATPTQLLALADKLICGHDDGRCMFYHYNNFDIIYPAHSIPKTNLHPSAVTCLCAYSPDYYFTCFAQGIIMFTSITVEGLERLSRIKTPRTVAACTILPNGMLAFAVNNRGLHEIYCIEDKINSDDCTIYPTTARHSNCITSLITAGNQLVSSSLDGEIKVWD